MTTSAVPHSLPIVDGGVDGAPPPSREAVARATAAACDWLIAQQHAEGYWCGELEGDTTLESYMIFLEAFFGRLGGDRAEGFARTIRGEALRDGGWAQYLGGPADLSV
jgi:squalene-hopene/tetraprenyl-beta-curcumene cyclase